ncbi:MAG: exodeoxyribonuclease VII large subunit, partial [Acidimicrobiia bacterium]
MAAVYTVSQVTAYLRESLEADPLLSDLFVVGEVSNLRVSGAGHAYFTLKDGQAVLNCVMFKGQSGAELLANGTSVSTHGHISFYEPRGSTDFMVDLAMPEGVGELALELERLKLRLESEGLFEESRKRSLPRFPQVVGVVTSPAGSVFHDIQNVIRRRYPLVELVLSPTQVQGSDAAPNIVRALQELNQEGRSDVIIMARGGGSLEELWPFNEETVARAIHASRIPVVSGIGHETDLTIADLVADMRAPTPSAAAELVVPDGLALGQELAELAERSHRTITYQLESRRVQVSELARRLAAGLPDL